ncbi:MAG: glycosyltransferase family 9 protein [Acidobacteria bacterium]|nr:glycosyltransferase family 9 protein [Acidobacteriota bacterium]
MGDIVHTLPAVATLKHSFPHSQLVWAVERKWAALVRGNPFVDQVVEVERSLAGLLALRRRLRETRFDLAVDFQGLIKSALVGLLARVEKIYGLHQSQARERWAALCYSTRVRVSATHIVDRHLELAAAAGASNVIRTFPLPPGEPQGKLPGGSFVLACPLAGWPSKQWPLEYYADLGERLYALGRPLVLNGPPQAMADFKCLPHVTPHCSSVAGLIDATRRAAAVVGIDSGPMHLAAALAKPGVAIFGPTDPARNGPCGDSLRVLRGPRAQTSYKRRKETDPSMREIAPEQVFEVLKEVLA